MTCPGATQWIEALYLRDDEVDDFISYHQQTSKPETDHVG